MELKSILNLQISKLISGSGQNGLSEEQINQFCCSICHSISNDPLQCQNCSQLFCTMCTSKWLKKSSICPFKCEQWDLQKASGQIIKDIQSLQFRCVNFERGCAEILFISNIEAHQSNCQVGLSQDEIIVLLRQKVSKLEHQIQIMISNQEIQQVTSKICQLKNEQKNGFQNSGSSQDQEEEQQTEKNSQDETVNLIIPLNPHLNQMMSVCDSGHKLEKMFLNNITKIQISQYTCSFCSQQYYDITKCQVLFCMLCLFAICPDCEFYMADVNGKNLCIQSEILCFKGHETNLKIMNKIHYSYFPGQGYLCNVCNQQTTIYSGIDNSCFRCQKCNFDVCFICNH